MALYSDEWGLKFFQNYEDISTTPSSSAAVQDDLTRLQVNSPTKEAYLGPITRSRARKLQEVNSFLADFSYDIDENYILPKSYALLLLSFSSVEVIQAEKMHCKTKY